MDGAAGALVVLAFGAGAAAHSLASLALGPGAALGLGAAAVTLGVVLALSS